jgi:hypothetical protein
MFDLGKMKRINRGIYQDLIVMLNLFQHLICYAVQHNS